MDNCAGDSERYREHVNPWRDVCRIISGMQGLRELGAQVQVPFDNPQSPAERGILLQALAGMTEAKVQLIDEQPMRHIIHVVH